MRSCPTGLISCQSGTPLQPTRSALFVRQIDVWAAYMAYTDYEIGRVIETIKELGQFDNTLIILVWATTA